MNKFLKVKSIEFIHSMNKILAETFEKLKIIDKRRIPNSYFKED